MTSKGELLQIHEQLCWEALEVMRKKNQDYTGTNPDPFANFRGVAIAMGVEPEIGLMVRMGDKMQRVKSFIENGFFAVEDEGILDIGHDMINYTVLLTAMLMDRKAAIDEAKGQPVDPIVRIEKPEPRPMRAPMKRKGGRKTGYKNKPSQTSIEGPAGRKA